MKYKRFEDLPVWKDASNLALEVFTFVDTEGFPGPYALKDQLLRAALSISNNIAEGFERGTNQELMTFLYIARGSAGEVRSMLCLLQRMPKAKTLESGILNLQSLAESISRQLGAWIASIKNSDYKGERFATDKVKHADLAARDRKAYLVELKKFREQA